MLTKINQRLYLLSQLKLQGLNIQALHILFTGLIMSYHVNRSTYRWRMTIDTGWAPYHEKLYDAVSHILTLTLTKSSIAQTANCFPRLLNLDIVYIISSLTRLPLQSSEKTALLSVTSCW